MKGGAADGVGEGGRMKKKRCDEESWRWRSRGTQRLSVSGHNMRWILWQTAQTHSISDVMHTADSIFSHPSTLSSAYRAIDQLHTHCEYQSCSQQHLNILPLCSLMLQDFSFVVLTSKYVFLLAFCTVYYVFFCLYLDDVAVGIIQTARKSS